MKKMILAILCAGLFLLTAHAAEIQVTAPVAGASWKIGSSQVVQWNFSGIAASNEVHVVLLQNGNNLGKIAENLDIGADGQGSFSWQVGSIIGNPAATAGSGYTIKVRRANDAAVFAMSAPFSLSSGSSGPVMQLPDASQLGSNYALGQASKPPMPGQSDVQVKMIQVTSPKAGDVLSATGTYGIYWKFINVPASAVSLTLLRDGEPVGTPNGSDRDAYGLHWNLNLQPPDPGTYKVAVETLDHAHRGLSGAFTVEEQGWIEPLSPKQGMIFVNGSSQEVGWKRVGNIQKLDLILMKADSGWTQNLAIGVDAKLEKLAVVLSPGEYGQYRIKFKYTVDGGHSYVYSGHFTIQVAP
jgi:hypothetical protein